MAYTAYRDLVLRDNPVNYWPLSESALPMLDLGSLAKNLTAKTGTGTPTFATAALIEDGGDALTMDGSVSLNSASYAISTGVASVEAWIKLTALPALNQYATVLLRGNHSWLRITDVSGTPKFYFYVYDGTTYHSAGSSTTVALNTLYHFVGTYDGSNIRVWVNGVNVATFAWAGTVASTAIAANVGGVSSSGLVGTVEEVAVYDYALDSIKILSHYNVGVRASGISMHSPPSTVYNDLIAAGYSTEIAGKVRDRIVV